ncbi:TatD family hydrolase [Radiobacillus sp. PE A8.2]|uniref:TatD family hydrolase n=1 Tax=Radiobacillus sp. PE A8.2 TaxID=3380349 RepID=UPI00388CED52
MKVIDAHIHLDLYKDDERRAILDKLEEDHVEALLCVSNHLDSAKENLRLSLEDFRVKPAFGYHPEQPLPSAEQIDELFNFIEDHQDKMVAVGEVGLPYYSRQENPELNMDGYIELLEKFILLAARLDKPIVLHAVYGDAPVVCDLLEKHGVKRAHFHWFKGDVNTVHRMMENGYFISITPDCLYEAEIQQLVTRYPLAQMMIETDGPWPFEGPFADQMTHPKMMHDTVGKIAELKKCRLIKFMSNCMRIQ